jgi:hypothetical protein
LSDSRSKPSLRTCCIFIPSKLLFAIRRILRGTNHIQRALYQIDKNNPRELLKTICKALAEAPNLEKKAGLQTFKNQVQKQKEATIDYRQRLRSQGIKVSSTWRGLGAAESNEDRFKLRTAKRGRSWSKSGLKAILHMLGLLYENTLQDFIKELNIDLVKKVDTEKMVTMSAGRIAKTVGRETLGIPQGGFPAVNKGTQGYAKLFRSILNPDPVF